MSEEIQFHSAFCSIRTAFPFANLPPLLPNFSPCYRYAGTPRMASGPDDRDEAISGSRLRGRRQPDLLQAEQQHVAGRRQEDVRRPPRPNPSALRGLIADGFRREKNFRETA